MIRLTDYKSNAPAYVRADQILLIAELAADNNCSKRTRVDTSKMTLLVSQSADEIRAAMIFANAVTNAVTRIKNARRIA